ncbi:MAG: TIGR04282 family arsenosugar biosynthesis glycosyltransferase [Acetobacteraceae bacterium]|nr:TIGR04282 family arsenosugar biosynthesis glycosyltransferase [Acetobacteraceae bacterium]
MGAAIGLMCKPPRLGKTRLAAGLGQGAAARLAAAFLADAAALAEEVALRAHAARMAFHAPPDAGAEVAALLPGWDVRPQAEGDLGARMGAAFGALFAAGATKALLIGADAPTLPPALLELALSHPAEAVLVPALDGGYCAIALRRASPALLDGIPWSTREVLAATRAAAARAGISLVELPGWHDVDEAADLPALRAGLAGQAPGGCSHLPPWRAQNTLAAWDELSLG